MQTRVFSITDQIKGGTTFILLAILSLTGCDAARGVVRDEVKDETSRQLAETKAEYDAKIAALEEEIDRQNEQLYSQQQERDSVVGFAIFAFFILGVFSALFLLGRPLLRVIFAIFLKRGPTKPRKII